MGVVLLIVVDDSERVHAGRSAAVSGLHVVRERHDMGVVELLQPHLITHSETQTCVVGLGFQDDVVQTDLLESYPVVLLAALTGEVGAGLRRVPAPGTVSLHPPVFCCRDRHCDVGFRPKHHNRLVL